MDLAPRPSALSPSPREIFSPRRRPYFELDGLKYLRLFDRRSKRRLLRCAESAERPGPSRRVRSPTRDLAKMVDCLTHRGPDDSGHRTATTHSALGFRRLSIVDLAGAGISRSRTRMRTVWTAFNGEIYNFPALRHQAGGPGAHAPIQSGDTEVLVHLYEDEGPGFRQASSGACSPWRSGTRPSARLVLARDRLGQKPLVYRVDGSRISVRERVEERCSSCPNPMCRANGRPPSPSTGI